MEVKTKSTFCDFFGKIINFYFHMTYVNSSLMFLEVLHTINIKVDSTNV